MGKVWERGELGLETASLLNRNIATACPLCTGRKREIDDGDSSLFRAWLVVTLQMAVTSSHAEAHTIAISVASDSQNHAIDRADLIRQLLGEKLRKRTKSMPNVGQNGCSNRDDMLQDASCINRERDGVFVER